MATISVRRQCIKLPIKLPVFLTRHHVCRPVLLLHSCILTMVFGLNQLLHCLWLEQWSSSLLSFHKTVFEMDKIVASMFFKKSSPAVPGRIGIERPQYKDLSYRLHAIGPHAPTNEIVDDRFWSTDRNAPLLVRLIAINFLIINSQLCN